MIVVDISRDSRRLLVINLGMVINKSTTIKLMFIFFHKIHFSQSTLILLADRITFPFPTCDSAYTVVSHCAILPVGNPIVQVASECTVGKIQ